MNKRTILLILVITTFILIFGSDLSKEEFKKVIKNTYNFYPADLKTDEERNQKSAKMDEFWNLVLSNKEKYIPYLREELQDFSNNEWFLFDGSSLLFRNTDNREDFKIIARAIEHTRLEDVDPTQYFFFLIDLGKNGVDTYKLVEKILDTPDFSVFLVRHVLRLGQDYTVLYCLLQIDEELYLENLIKRLKQEKKPQIIKTIILNLAFTVTQKGQKAIFEFSETTSDKELKKYAQKFTKLENKKNLPPKEVSSKRENLDVFFKLFKTRNYPETNELDYNKYMEELPYLIRKEDYDKIKKIRREIAYRISDEALHEISFLTQLLQYAYTSND
jgi:hypothetical protein